MKLKKIKIYKIVVLVLLILAVGYYGTYRYFRDKLTPLDVSGYVNLFDSDLALQIESVSYTFPAWIDLGKGTFYYNQEPVFSFENAKISVGLFSAFSENKNFDFEFMISKGKIFGSYSNSNLSLDIVDVELQDVPIACNYKLKGVANTKLKLRFDEDQIKSGDCDVLVSSLGFSGKNDFVTDTSLNLGKLSLRTSVKDSLLTIEKVNLSGEELELSGIGDAIFHSDKTWEVDFRGKKQFSASFFDKIKNGFFIGLYLADAIGQDCYFKVDYGMNGLDYRKIKDDAKISELEEKLAM